MDVGSNPVLIGLIALIGLLVLFGPPIWWYRHGRDPRERRKPNWWAIIFGVIVLIGTRGRIAKGDWVGWAVSLVRYATGAWIIAWGAKGSRKFKL